MASPRCSGTRARRRLWPWNTSAHPGWLPRAQPAGAMNACAAGGTRRRIWHLYNHLLSYTYCVHQRPAYGLRQAQGKPRRGFYGATSRKKKRPVSSGPGAVSRAPCQNYRSDTMKCSCVVTAALAYLTLAQIPQCVAASGLSEAKAKLLQHIESGERPDVKIWEEYGAAYSAHKR